MHTRLTLITLLLLAVSSPTLSPSIATFLKTNTSSQNDTLTVIGDSQPDPQINEMMASTSSSIDSTNVISNGGGAVSLQDISDFLVYYGSAEFIVGPMLKNYPMAWNEVPYSMILSFLYQKLYPHKFVYKVPFLCVPGRDDYVDFHDYKIQVGITSLFILMKILGSRVFKNIAKESMTMLEVEFFSVALINLLFFTDNDTLELAVFRNLVISFMISICLVIIPFYTRTPWRSSKFLETFMFATYVMSFLTNVVVLEYWHLKENFVTWLWQYLFFEDSAQRRLIIGYWMVFALMIAYVLMTIVGKSTIKDHQHQDLTKADSLGKTLNFNRKIWHFVIFMMFVPFMNHPPQIEFLKMISALLILVFLNVELVRYLGTPIGTTINEILGVFKDTRDSKGPILISYLYLIIGVSIPMFFNDSVIGLVALGVGDSVASIVGKRFGHINEKSNKQWRLTWKWFDTSKTVVGTMAFIVVCYVICDALKNSFQFESLENYSNWNLFITCTVGGLVEAWSDINDNLLLPCVMVATMESLKNVI
ncbi:dolichol kinase [Saccharomycopsis crataegensis]|uniref:dolichol kinase n=1 Tax=Saccharomycopsis crataegensis TaxID=43959 RepID=A0AAV5QEU1_9ASCO|nr:dolichol kinase [Saccharomycopsis crataegensis]